MRQSLHRVKDFADHRCAGSRCAGEIIVVLFQKFDERICLARHVRETISFSRAREPAKYIASLQWHARIDEHGRYHW